MAVIVLKCKSASPGKCSGEALTSTDMIAFGGTPILKTGVVGEPNHVLLGQSIAGKILVYPTGKGSTGDPYSCYFLTKYGNAPKAIINRAANSTTVVAAILCDIPMVYACEKDPLQVIETGDWVEVDADQGLVTVRKKAGCPRETGEHLGLNLQNSDKRALNKR
jgi:predicted aconitase with swiveling domain